jgi:hypothetical protein
MPTHGGLCSNFSNSNFYGECANLVTELATTNWITRTLKRAGYMRSMCDSRLVVGLILIETRVVPFSSVEQVNCNKKKPLPQFRKSQLCDCILLLSRLCVSNLNYRVTNPIPTPFDVTLCDFLESHWRALTGSQTLWLTIPRFDTCLLPCSGLRPRQSADPQHVSHPLPRRFCHSSPFEFRPF